MILRNAERQQAKIKLALQGPSGSGKTFSSILLAKGLTNDLSKVCLIDTENGSADLYAHLGDFKVITLVKPYTPDHYIQAMELPDRCRHGMYYHRQYFSLLGVFSRFSCRTNR